MNVFSQPESRLAHFSGAVEFFEEYGIIGTPELRFIEYKRKQGPIQIPAWIGKRSDGAMAAVPIFSIPSGIENPASATITANTVDKGDIYSDANTLYMALETDNGMGFFQINVIYNSYIAATLAYFFNITIDCDYRLRAFNVIGAGGILQREYYWVGYPKHGEDPKTFPYPAFPAFYLDESTNAAQSPKLEPEAEIVEPNEFFFKNNTLWRTSEHKHLGLSIRAEYDPEIRCDTTPN